MTATARKLLVGNWFDISLVRIRVTRGVINLQGHAQKTSEGTLDLRQVEASLRKLDDELRSMAGFRGVAYFFDNWIREPTGSWRYIGPREKGKKR